MNIDPCFVRYSTFLIMYCYIHFLKKKVKYYLIYCSTSESEEWGVRTWFWLTGYFHIQNQKKVGFPLFLIYIYIFWIKLKSSPHSSLFTFRCSTLYRFIFKSEEWGVRTWFEFNPKNIYINQKKRKTNFFLILNVEISR